MRRLLPVFFIFGLVLTARGRGTGWHARDIAGALPPLEFSMRRANDGRAVSAADYRGKVVLLYFGYTNCPDVCPATLANLAQVLDRLGPSASQVRVLFVTVDPERDVPAAMKAYVSAFAPQMDGLAGDADEVARVARRYRVAYAIRRAGPGRAYEVNHSAAVFFFDRTGRSRLVTLSTEDVDGLASDVRQLLFG